MPYRDRKNDNDVNFWSNFQTWSDLFVFLLDEVSDNGKLHSEVEIADFLLPSDKKTASELDARLRSIRNWKTGTKPRRRSFQILTKQFEIKSGTALHSRWLELYGKTSEKRKNHNQSKPDKQHSDYVQRLVAGSFQIVRSYGKAISVCLSLLLGAFFLGNFDSPDNPNEEKIQDDLTAPAKPRQQFEITSQAPELHGEENQSVTSYSNAQMAEKFSLSGLHIGDTADLSVKYHIWKEEEGFPIVSWVRRLENGHISFTTDNGKRDGKIIAIARSFVTKEIKPDEFDNLLREQFGPWSGYSGYKSRPFWRAHSNLDQENCIISAYHSKIWVLDNSVDHLIKIGHEPYDSSNHAFFAMALDYVKNDCGIIAVTWTNRTGNTILLVVDTHVTSKILRRQKQAEQEALARRKSAEETSIKFD